LTLVSPELGKKFEELRHGMISNKAADTSFTNRAEVRLIKDQNSEAKVRTFTLVQDEPQSVWGTGKGPTPTDYFIASVGFCENVIFARNASMANLTIDSLETTVTGTWDRRGLFEIDGVKPSFKTITVETKITTKDPVQKAVEVANQTHRRCPVHATLSRATEMIFRLNVNGQSVPL
jgi:putative redox protein